MAFKLSTLVLSLITENVFPHFPRSLVLLVLDLILPVDTQVYSAPLGAFICYEQVKPRKSIRRARFWGKHVRRQPKQIQHWKYRCCELQCCIWPLSKVSLQKMPYELEIQRTRGENKISKGFWFLFKLAYKKHFPTIFSLFFQVDVL